MATTSRDQQLREMRLSDGNLPGHSYGGYEIHYVTEDGGILCHHCANRENGSEAYIGTDPSGELGSDPQWYIVGHDCHWEGPAIQCDHCGRDIESEYGDPEAEDEPDDDDTGPARCDSCQMLSVNGIPCHETGCPDAWKGRDFECFECGRDFRPEHRYQGTCPDCLNPEESDPMTPKDFADYADSVTYCNQRESGMGDDEGDWYFGDDDTLTVYSGTFGNDHSPGASHYTYHDTYDNRAEYDARMAELDAMPEYIDDDEESDD